MSNPSISLVLLLLFTPAARADSHGTEEETPRYRFGFELKGHYRDSDEARFPIPLEFDPEQLLPGLTVEWNDNTFVRAGRDESADEFLATLRWEMDWGS